MNNIKNFLSNLNKKRKDAFNKYYVSTRRFNELEEKYKTLINWTTKPTDPKTSTPEILSIKKAANDFKDEEICIFVSYAETPQIKKHVNYHIKCLEANGIKTILVLNTDRKHEANNISIPNNIREFHVRDNVGFDFGAWSQILSINPGWRSAKKIYLINDSIVGPFSENGLKSIISEIRNSQEDLIGLTDNLKPQYHLQSYFLSINNTLLSNDSFYNYLITMKNLPTKQMVIDGYETRLSKFAEDLGYTTKAIFSIKNYKTKKDKTIYHAEEIIKQGFPYLKVSLLNTAKGASILEKQNFQNFR